MSSRECGTRAAVKESRRSDDEINVGPGEIPRPKRNAGRIKKVSVELPLKLHTPDD